MEENFKTTISLINSFISDKDNLDKIYLAGNIIVEAIKNGGKVISCGNGGSMSDAMHFAEELTGNFKTKRKAIPAIAISDPAHLSCVANDFGYDFVFSRFIEAHANNGDVLLAISTSGNSQNIINAVQVARERGMKVIGLTGKDGGKLNNLCDVELRIPYFGYSDRIQELHIMIIHNLIEYIESNL